MATSGGVDRPLANTSSMPRTNDLDLQGPLGGFREKTAKLECQSKDRLVSLLPSGVLNAQRQLDRETEDQEGFEVALRAVLRGGSVVPARYTQKISKALAQLQGLLAQAQLTHLQESKRVAELNREGERLRERIEETFQE